jgi:hypothetical protein
VPRISGILARASGGLPTVIAALRLCEDPQATAFLDRYDAISDSDLERLTIEEICVAAGIATKDLLGLAVAALVEDSQSAGRIIAATYHPRVIEATARSAVTPNVSFNEDGKIRYHDGHADRKLFLQGTGFLPAPVNRPGGVFQVSFTNQNANINTPADPDHTPFVSPEDDLKALHTLLDGNRQLEAPREVVGVSAQVIGHQYRDEEMLECVPIGGSNDTRNPGTPK